MLDEERKRLLRRIDIRNIRPNGILWVWGEEVRTYQLTKEEIRYLRWYHKNNNIAPEVDVRLNSNYKIKKDRNKYNDGNCRTKRPIKKSGFRGKVIIGSMVVAVTVGAIIGHHHSTPNNDTSVTVEIPKTEFGDEEQTLDHEESRKETIRHYCDIYQVDFDTTYDKIKHLTGNFSNGDYLDGHIAGVTCKGFDVYANCEEELLVYAVRAIKQVPERFGLDDSIHIHNGYNSGTDYCAQISDVCELLGLDRNFMYAVVRYESNFDSYLFNYQNNPAGLISGVDPVTKEKIWWSFDTKEEGLLEVGMELLKFCKKHDVDPMQIDRTAVEKIQIEYAPESDGNYNWAENVMSILEEARENETELFGGEEVHGLGR